MIISRRVQGSHTPETRDPGWYLEGFAAEDKTWIIPVKPFPFLIGRLKSCQLQLSSSQISRHHATIYQRNHLLWIREFGSTNGTFVNRQRLTGECVLHDGDILHFGSLEFRLSHKAAMPVHSDADEDATRRISMLQLPEGFVACEAEFSELLRRGAVVPYFQPIVRLEDQRIVGYELLGRGDFEGLPFSPWPLLQIARKLGREIELSELFRRVGIQQAGKLGDSYHLFFNTVPAEMDLRSLRLSLGELRVQAPSLPLAMEVHETAVTNVAMMRELRALLAELDIQLVYDDFGAGQARLVELIEVPPDCLKFDIVLIHDIHRQSPRAQRVLQTLVYMAGELGIKTLAEGVELLEEMEACIKIGFDFAQGHYLGKPEPGFRTESGHTTGQFQDR